MTLSFDQQTLLDHIQSRLEFSPSCGKFTSFDDVKNIAQSLPSHFQSIPSVHVAGTNGKGSVCRSLASILSSLIPSLKIGLTISPHIHSFYERISIYYQGKCNLISPIDVIQHSKKIIDSEKKNQTVLSFFPFISLLSFLYFSYKKVDLMIVETGLGGRLDATNILQSDIQVITSIGLDHTSVLGSSLEKIFKEKLGILTHSSGCLISGVDPNLVTKEQNFIKKNTSTFLQINQDFSLNPTNKTHFIFNIQNYTSSIYTPSPLPPFQKHNLSLSLATIYTLKQKKILPHSFPPLSPLNINFSKFSQGRMQTLSIAPLIILDCAHNPHAFKAMIVALREDTRINKINLKTCIIGLSEDKNFEDILALCSSFFDKFIYVDLFHPRALPFSKVKNSFLKTKRPFQQTSSLQSFISSLKKASPDQLFVVCGSLFLASPFIHAFSSSQPSPSGEASQ